MGRTDPRIKHLFTYLSNRLYAKYDKLIQQKFVEKSRTFSPGYLEGYHSCIETIQTLMAQTPDFIKQLREPPADTAKAKRETTQETSAHIKENFVSEPVGWDLFFGDKDKQVIKNFGPLTKHEQATQKIDEYFRDMVSELLICPDSVSPVLFYQSILTAVKHEYECYNAQAKKLAKLYDLLAGKQELVEDVDSGSTMK